VFGLHRAKLSDWENITDEQRNVWQKLAYRSYGTLTPANLASVAGGIVGIYGLVLVYDGALVGGLLLLAIGRIADLLDGLIAEYTKTKSPLGELIDAVVDKLVIAFAVVVFLAVGIVPWPLVITVAILNGFNGVVSVLGRMRGRVIHPSKFGKYSTALAWITLIFYPLGQWVGAHESLVTGAILVAGAIISFGFYVVFGLIAAASYARLLSQGSRR